MGKEVTVRRNWVAGTGEPMSYKRNRLGQCECTEVKKFVKISWRRGAVSMVLFSSRFMASVTHIRLSSLLKYC